MKQFNTIALSLALALCSTAVAAQSLLPAAHRNPINRVGGHNVAQKTTGTGSRLLASSHYNSSGTALVPVDSQQYNYAGITSAAYNQQLTYQYNAGAWIPNLDFDYTLDANEKTTYANIQHWSTSTNSYGNQGHTTYTLNAGGACTMSLNQLWLPATSTYRDNVKDTYTLNSDNLVTNEIYQNWDYGSNALLNAYQYTYTLNAQGNITQELTQEWDASIHWYNNYCTTYTYDATGEHITSISGKQWDINNAAWMNTYQTLNTLDASGNVTSAIYKIWNNSTSTYAPYYSITYAMDAAGNDTLITYQQWNSTTSTYQNYQQYVYTYNSDNQNTSYMGLYWDGSAYSIGQYTNRYNYYYEPYTTTGISNTATLTGLKVYPTLCSNQLFADNSDATLSYHIVSVTGAVISEGTLQAGHNSIPTSNLTPGMYVLQVAGNTNKAAYRFIKQ